jgi:hypothetical protein
MEETEPPDWCITGSGNSLDAETNPEMALSPQAWKDWLATKRAGKKSGFAERISLQALARGKCG